MHYMEDMEDIGKYFNQIYGSEVLCREFCRMVIQSFERYPVTYLYNAELNGAYKIIYTIDRNGLNPSFKQKIVSKQTMMDTLDIIRGVDNGIQ